MPIYQVDEDQVSLKPVKTTEDFAELMSCAPMDLDELEQDLLTLEQQPAPIIHHFGPGVYMREARLPAECILLGHKQKFPQLNVMLAGRATADDGTTLMAPLAYTGGPGRKCVVTHEDVVWVNIHATDEQNVGILEATLMDKTPAALAQERERATKQTDEVLSAKADYALMWSKQQIDGSLVRRMSDFTGDRAKLPWGAYKFRTAPSPIDGMGVMASADIEPGERIGPALVGGLRTVLGYYVNHSGEPNAKFVKRGEEVDLVATSWIQGNMGGRFGEEITVDYRESNEVALWLA